MPLVAVPGLLYRAVMPLWKKASPDGSARPKRILAGHNGSAEAVAIAPDGTWLATVSWDETGRIWAADGTPRAVLTGHKEAVERVAIAPDGTWLATVSWDGTGRIWAADGASLVTGGEDGTARIWAADGAPRAVLSGHGGPVEAVAIAPDGTWLATTS